MLLLVACAGGCETQRPTSLGFTNIGRVEWRSTSTENRVGGIDEASLTYMQYGEDRIIIWIDIQENCETGGSDKHQSGFEESLDGRRIEWDCRIADGNVTITIDGKKYYPSKGTVFFVSTADGVRIRQSKRNATKMKCTREALTELAKTDQEIIQFFKKAAPAN